LAISQERMVSSTVRRHIGLMLDSYDRSARRPPIVFATLPGERHELGLLTSAMLCASRGFKVHYLGPDLPAAEIARFARESAALVVAISVVLHEQLASVPAQLQELAAGLAPETAIWVGGGAARALSPGSLPQHCFVLKDGADLEQRLDLLSG